MTSLRVVAIALLAVPALGQNDASARVASLFRAHRYVEALKLLGESPESPGDRFLVARSHEELYARHSDDARRARDAAAAAQRDAELAAKSLEQLRRDGLHRRISGGTAATVVEAGRLAERIRASSARATASGAKAQAEERDAQRSFEAAREGFRELEKLSGQEPRVAAWARAAKSARTTMEWMARHREWRLPPVARER